MVGMLPGLRQGGLHCIRVPDRRRDGANHSQHAFSDNLPSHTINCLEMGDFGKICRQPCTVDHKADHLALAMPQAENRSSAMSHSPPTVQVRTKTFVAVGHESANNVRAKDHMQANLLANMELGGNRQGRAAEGASPRSTADSGIQLQPIGKSDDPVYQMRGTVESDDDYYSRRSPQQVRPPPLQNSSSASVHATGVMIACDSACRATADKSCLLTIQCLNFTAVTL